MTGSDEEGHAVDALAEAIVKKLTVTIPHSAPARIREVAVVDPSDGEVLMSWGTVGVGG